MVPPLRRLDVYGYAVMYKLDSSADTWTVDPDDEYRHLPAHYLSMDEALDRVAFLKSRGIPARVAALVAEPTDTADEFEANRIGEDE